MFDTKKGLNSHLAQARSCKWYWTYQKTSALDHLNEPIVQDDLGLEHMRMDTGDPDMDGKQVGEMLQEFKEDNDIFHFVCVEAEEVEPQIGVAGPGPST